MLWDGAKDVLKGGNQIPTVPPRCTDSIPYCPKKELPAVPLTTRPRRRKLSCSGEFVSPSLCQSESACRRQRSDSKIPTLSEGTCFSPLSPLKTGINSLQICLHNERERCTAPVAARGSPQPRAAAPPDLTRTVPVCAFKSAAFTSRSRLRFCAATVVFRQGTASAVP
jgi:hypothetical protein